MEHPFILLFSNSNRRILGVMSGTSLDGIDIADVSVTGSGKDLQWTLNGFYSQPYSDGLQEILLLNSDSETGSLPQITVLGDIVAQEYESAIHSAIGEWGTDLSDYSAVGSHGQTLFHQPELLQLDSFSGVGSIQIGDPAMMSHRLGIPVVGDFRVADMAFGGHGAPLVPYFDYVTFCDPNESRLLINIGGIANITALPAASGLQDIRAFDTGPGNMILDVASRQFLGEEFDRDGRTASRGTVSSILFDELVSDEWFAAAPPRSTGREMFSAAYNQRVFGSAEALGLSTEDLLATLTSFSARTILDAWERFVRPDIEIDSVLVSGGGIYNKALMSILRGGFRGIPVSTTAAVGVDPDAKEAVCFAVLAHETLNGVPTGVPGATGASRSAVLGKICLPPTEIQR